MDLTLAIVLIIVCALVGIIVGFLVCMFLPVMKAKRAQTNANKIINDAENKADRIKKNAQIDAKQDIFEMKKEAEKDIKERKEEVVVSENKLNQREQTIDARDAALLKKEQSLEDKDKNLDFSIQENKKRGALLQEKIDSIIVELQKVANMSEKEARDQIFAKVEEKEQINIAKFLREKEDEAETTANDKARDILANALARQAQEVT